MAPNDPSAGRKVIRGPFSLFDDSFIVEFIEPDPSFHASVLCRTTLKANHPLVRLGKKHPFVPPLHLHFDQTETFLVVQGSICLTVGYDLQERTLSAGDDSYGIPPCVPHTPWPNPKHTHEDTVLVMWAHPDKVSEPMDHVFFESIFRYTSEMYQAGKVPDLLQVMLMQHATASTLVVAPGLNFLGSLRWSVPWAMQAGIARLALSLGYKPTLEKYYKDE